jgi:putative ABC transport system permease protein
MFRTAMRNVLAHKARLLMTLLAVTLGVAFVSGTLVFTDTIGHALRRSSAKSYQDISVAIRAAASQQPADSGNAPPRSRNPGNALPQKLLDRARELPGAATATGTVAGFTALADKHGDLVGGGWSTQGANYSADRYPLADGRAPSGADQVALDSATAKRTGYRVGDTVRMSVDGPVIKAKVTGVFTTDDGNVSAGGSLVLFDTATAQKLFGKPGGYDEIDIRAAAGTSQNALRAEARKILPAGAEATTGQKLAADEAKTIASRMDNFNTTLLAFAGIALFVGVFLIVNTFTMLVAQRTKELALLRAVGASRRQVTRSVLGEAALVGLGAAVTGLAAGVGIAVGMRSLLGSLSGGQLPEGPLAVEPATIVAGLAVGVGVTVLSAWLPARRAAKIPPVAAMTALHTPPTAKGLRIRNTIGALLASAGGVLVVLGTRMGGNGKLPMGAGAAVLVVGVFVLTPQLSRPVIAAAGPLLRPLGITGKLARQNSVRNPRRTAATASALMIGLTLITGLTVVAVSVQKTIDQMATDSLRADYQISMANARFLSPEVDKELTGQREITAASPLRLAASTVDGRTEALTGVDAEDIGKLLHVDFSSGSLAELHGDSVVVDSDTAKSHGWRTGRHVTVRYADGTRGTLTIAGVYQGNELIKGVLVDNATVTPHLKDVIDMRVLVKTAGGASEANRKALVAALGDNPVIKVQDRADISREVASLITTLLNVLYGLLAMAVLVAVLGVINTLAMSVFERQHEIGMLRAVGLDRGRVKRMVRLESLIISLFGAVLGIGLGVFFGWAVGRLIGDSLTAYELVLPWDRIGLFLALAVLVGVLAALWPARRAAKLDMLSAIKAE